MDQDPTKAAAVWNSSRTRLWRGWQSKWFNEIVEHVPDAPGVYVLGLGKDTRTSVSIPRLAGVDKHGVLDIGESKSLRARFVALRRCVTVVGATGHMAGWRYGYLQLSKHLVGRLYLSWTTSSDCYALEGELLHAYLSAFRELPPLNYKFNWSRMRRHATDRQPQRGTIVGRSGRSANTA